MKNSHTKRRAFLQTLAACLALPGSLLHAQETPAPANPAIDSFLKAANQLTGLKLEDRELAAVYLEALQKQFGPVALTSLSGLTQMTPAAYAKAVKAAPLKTIADQAILLWMTGFVTDPASQSRRVAAYTDAGVWQALTFTKPPGQCGGAFGYWADLPAA